MKRKIVHDMEGSSQVIGDRFIGNRLSRLKGIFRAVDWQLLLFLLLFLDVKMVCKLIAIVFIYALRFDLRFGLRRTASRLPLFYIGMIGIALLDWVLYGLYGDRHYNIAFSSGILVWVLCLLAIHQVKLFVERSEAATLHRTLLVFFAINAAVSFLMLLKIMITVGSINPYAYQGDFQKYYLGTGDYIKGLFFDVSSTNAIVNAFGVVYFLSRRQVSMVLICMTVLLLTGSNAIDLLVAIVLIGIFLFRSDRDRKSLIVLTLFLLILFMAKISPENLRYASTRVTTMIGRKDPAGGAYPVIRDLRHAPDSLLDPEQKKQKFAILYMDSVGGVVWNRNDSIYKQAGSPPPPVRTLPQTDLSAPEYQRRDDTTITRRKLIAFMTDPGMTGRVREIGAAMGRMPGKIFCMRQTAGFLVRHPRRLLIGNGMGRFSSKLAFRSVALGIEGNYPLSLQYIDSDFRNLHLAAYLSCFTKDASYHSMLNTPDNVYDQLLGEYGLAGLCLFIFAYIGFFGRHRRRFSYGLPLLVIMMAAFFTGYWFEQLSVVVLFELMILLDIGKEGEKT